MKNNEDMNIDSNNLAKGYYSDDTLDTNNLTLFTK